MAVETATVSPTQVEAPTATPATEPVNAPASTAQSGSEAAGAAPSEETFFSGDPNSLPPELQSAYKNMLKDYKSKTSEVAQVRKKAEQFDQISKDQRFVEYWGNLNKQQKANFKEQKAETEKRLGEKISDERFQKSFETKDGFLDLIADVVKETTVSSQKKIEELEQYKQVTDASNFVEAFATEQGQDGKPIRPDFYKLDEDSLITGFLQLNAGEGLTPEQYQTKLNEAYTWAKATTQKYFELGKAEALKIIQQKAASSSNPPTQAAKGAYTGSDPKKLSVREAIELAKKGQRVPQD